MLVRFVDRIGFALAVIATFVLAVAAVGFVRGLAFTIFVLVLFFVGDLVIVAGLAMGAVELFLREWQHSDSLKRLRSTIGRVVGAGVTMWLGLWGLNAFQTMSLRGLLLGCLIALSTLSYMDLRLNLETKSWLSPWSFWFRLLAYVIVYWMFRSWN
jgi:uncharacterized membrane protein